MKFRATYRGLTVLEAMVLFAVIGVILIVTLGGINYGCKSILSGAQQQKAAEKEARQHAAKLGWDFTGVSCADIDSDGDGYISCTVALRSGGDKELECRGAYSPGHGCRPKVLVLPRQVPHGD